MDLNNLNDLSQMRGMFNVNEMVGTDMDIFPNIFGNKMHMYTSDVCCKIQECAKMLENMWIDFLRQEDVSNLLVKI